MFFFSYHSCSQINSSCVFEKKTENRRHNIKGTNYYFSFISMITFLCQTVECCRIDSVDSERSEGVDLFSIITALTVVPTATFVLMDLFKYLD